MKHVMSVRMGLIAALAAAWLSAAPLAHAQGEKETIVFVDMNKVFDEFYKTKLAQDNLKDQEAEFKEEMQKQLDEFKALQDKFKKVREESEDRVLNEDARNARRSEAEEMLVELREMESKIRRFEEGKRRQVADTMKRVRDNLVVEIKKTLSDYAKSQNYLAVLDTSGDNMNGVPNILFFDESRDITPVVLDLLNRGKK